MGKTIEKIRLWNMLDESSVRAGEVKPLETQALIDTGAGTIVLPGPMARTLRLLSLGMAKVRYADGRVEEREFVVGVRVEILGRSTVCRALVEPNRSTPLVGQIVLEDLDLFVDSRRGRVIPNPDHPDEPIIDVLAQSPFGETNYLSR